MDRNFAKMFFATCSIRNPLQTSFFGGKNSPPNIKKVTTFHVATLTSNHPSHPRLRARKKNQPWSERSSLTTLNIRADNPDNDSISVCETCEIIKHVKNRALKQEKKKKKCFCFPRIWLLLPGTISAVQISIWQKKAGVLGKRKKRDPSESFHEDSGKDPTNRENRSCCGHSLANCIRSPPPHKTRPFSPSQPDKETFKNCDKHSLLYP